MYSNFKCSKCKRGLFLFNNTCIEKCPDNYRADKMTWNCMQIPIFAWYWDFPSKNSCKDYCKSSGEDKNIPENNTSSNNSTNDYKENNNTINDSANNNMTDKNKTENFNSENSNSNLTLNKVDDLLKRIRNSEFIIDSNCSCNVDCQQRGNCCYDFDLYCSNSK